MDGCLHLHQIAVHPDQARRGFGTTLMDGVFERAAGRPVTLTTFRDVPWNGPWYARLGFSEAADPGPGLAAILAGEHAAGLTDLGIRIAMTRPEHNGHIQ